MKSADENFFIFIAAIFFLVGILSAATAFSLNRKSVDTELRNRAVELNQAQYNPKTGAFEWLNKDLQYIVDNRR